MIFSSCSKEIQDICVLETKNKCTQSGTEVEFLFEKCNTLPKLSFIQNFDHLCLFTNDFPVNKPAKLSIIDMDQRQVKNTFEIPGNTELRYWYGDYFYYLKFDDDNLNVGLMQYNLVTNTSKLLIETKEMVTIQIIDDRMYLTELLTGVRYFPSFSYPGNTFEIDLLKGKVSSGGNLSDQEEVRHIYFEKRDDDLILISVFEDKRVEYNYSKKVPIGDFALDIDDKIESYVYQYGEIFHYKTGKGNYFYHQKYKTSVSDNIGSFVLLNNDYYLINNKLHFWNNTNEVVGYKGPQITASNRALYYFINETICYISGSNINIQKFTESQPSKVITYCKSLDNFTFTTVIGDDLILQQKEGLEFIKIKMK